jgi:hypothetical protein
MKRYPALLKATTFPCGFRLTTLALGRQKSPNDGRGLRFVGGHSHRCSPCGSSRRRRIVESGWRRALWAVQFLRDNEPDFAVILKPKRPHASIGPNSSGPDRDCSQRFRTSPYAYHFPNGQPISTMHTSRRPLPESGMQQICGRLELKTT